LGGGCFKWVFGICRTANRKSGELRKHKKKYYIGKRKNWKGKKQQLFVLAFLFDICNLKEKTEQEKRILQIFFPK
jgi:hypothetical protein